jgi:lysophospholipase
MTTNGRNAAPPPAFGELARGGATMRTAHWKAIAERPRGTVVLLHGRTEFIEKYFEVVRELLERGFAVWTMDWRGQGLSTRAHGNRSKGAIDRFETFLGDLDALVDLAREEDDRLPRYVLAHSMGGHVALRYVHDRPRAFDKAVLSAPMVDIVLPGGRPGHALGALIARAVVALGGSAAYAPGGRDYWEVPFDGNVLTNDAERHSDEREAIRACSDLALGGPTWGWLDAALRSIARLNDPGYARGIRTPVLICSAGDDSVVANRAQRALCEHMPFARLVVIAGAKHEMLKETDAVRAQFWRAFDDFIP